MLTTRRVPAATWHDKRGPAGHVPRKVIVPCALALLVSTAASAQAPPSTSVALTFRGPDGEAVTITRAQLLITAWGVSDEHDLPIRGDVVELDLESTRPSFERKIADLSGYVYVKASGYVPLVSEPFTWPALVAPTTIDFRDGRRMSIERGGAIQLTVTLRRPQPRRIRLLDANGRAVAGAKVDIAAYWEAPNRCGFFNGIDKLASGATDSAGVLAVPDLDGTYALFLEDRNIVFTDSKPSYDLPWQGLVTRLTREETPLRVRRRTQERLVIDVVDGGKPLAGAVLWADMMLGACGAGWGALATADARGRIRVDDFSREWWRAHWVCANGKQVWVMPEGSRLPDRIDVGITPSADPNHLANVCEKSR